MQDSLSIQLQFVGQKEAQAFDKAYWKVRLHKPKTKVNGPATKLFKYRITSSPMAGNSCSSGRWDQSRRIGKVIAGRAPDGTTRLANEIVYEGVLRKCSADSKRRGVVDSCKQQQGAIMSKVVSARVPLFFYILAGRVGPTDEQARHLQLKGMVRRLAGRCCLANAERGGLVPLRT